MGLLGFETVGPTPEPVKGLQVPGVLAGAVSGAVGATAPTEFADLLIRIAALPADQRAVLARLLAPPSAASPPAGPTLDDSVPPDLERTAGHPATPPKGDAG